jgi:hypothetical protein
VALQSGLTANLVLFLGGRSDAAPAAPPAFDDVPPFPDGIGEEEYPLLKSAGGARPPRRLPARRALRSGHTWSGRAGGLLPSGSPAPRPARPSAACPGPAPTEAPHDRGRCRRATTGCAPRRPLRPAPTGRRARRQAPPTWRCRLGAADLVVANDAGNSPSALAACAANPTFTWWPPANHPHPARHHRRPLVRGLDLWSAPPGGAVGRCLAPCRGTGVRSFCAENLAANHRGRVRALFSDDRPPGHSLRPRARARRPHARHRLAASPAITGAGFMAYHAAGGPPARSHRQSLNASRLPRPIAITSEKVLPLCHVRPAQRRWPWPI